MTTMRRISGRLATWVALLGVAVGSSPTPSAAQSEVPEVRAELVPGGPGDRQAALRLAIPEGWYVYAPDTGDLGLPMAARWETEDRTEPAMKGWPESEARETGAGPVRIYTGPVVIPLVTPPSDGARLVVSWGLCRDDLCVPQVREFPAPGA
jgi:DsbC/DsbD-like thiol-disulfide interchange protein